jgi:hypothetical protein
MAEKLVALLVARLVEMLEPLLADVKVEMLETMSAVKWAE